MQTAHMREMSQIGLAHQQELGRARFAYADTRTKLSALQITPCRRYENYQTNPSLGAPVQVSGSKVQSSAKLPNEPIAFGAVQSFEFKVQSCLRIFVPFVSLWFTLEITKRSQDLVPGVFYTNCGRKQMGTCV